MRHTLLVALTLLAATAFGGSHRHTSWTSVNCGTCVTPMGDDVESCADLRVVFNDADAVRAEENVQVGDVRSLVVRPSENGGVYVRPATGSRFSVTACKAATLADALDRVRVRVDGENVTTTGPRSDDQWLVYYIVQMPRGARGDFETSNGPVSIRDVDGTIVARAENGPVSAKDTIGSVDLKAENGPVAFSGSSGHVVLRTENGPISVKLTDTFWANGTLDARSDNGPLSLKIPRAFRSGVTVDTDGRSPVKCRAEDCRNARMSREDDGDWSGHWPRHIDLGSGPVSVTLSTNNGPVSIDER